MQGIKCHHEKRMTKIRNRKEIIRIIKFCIVGCINTFITAAVIYVMMYTLAYNYIVSNIVGYVIGVINSFIWNKLWVFQARQTNIWKEMGWFTAAFLIAYGVQFVFLLFMVEKLYMNEYLSQFLGLFLYGGINFIMNRVLTFRKENDK